MIGLPKSGGCQFFKEAKWVKTNESREWSPELVSCVNDGGDAEFGRVLSAWLFQKADEAARLYWPKVWFFPIFLCLEPGVLRRRL